MTPIDQQFISDIMAVNYQDRRAINYVKTVFREAYESEFRPVAMPDFFELPLSNELIGFKASSEFQRVARKIQFRLMRNGWKYNIWCFELDSDAELNAYTLSRFITSRDQVNTFLEYHTLRDAEYIDVALWRRNMETRVEHSAIFNGLETITENKTPVTLRVTAPEWSHNAIDYAQERFDTNDFDTVRVVYSSESSYPRVRRLQPEPQISIGDQHHTFDAGFGIHSSWRMFLGEISNTSELVFEHGWVFVDSEFEWLMNIDPNGLDFGYVYKVSALFSEVTHTDAAVVE